MKDVTGNDNIVKTIYELGEGILPHQPNDGQRFLAPLGPAPLPTGATSKAFDTIYEESIVGWFYGFIAELSGELTDEQLQRINNTKDIREKNRLKYNFITGKDMTTKEIWKLYNNPKAINEYKINEIIALDNLCEQYTTHDNTNTGGTPKDRKIQFMNKHPLPVGSNEDNIQVDTTKVVYVVVDLEASDKVVGNAKIFSIAAKTLDGNNSFEGKC